MKCIPRCLVYAGHYFLRVLPCRIACLGLGAFPDFAIRTDAWCPANPATAVFISHGINPSSSKVPGHA